MSDRMEDDPHDTNSQQSLEQNDLELQADEEFATMSDIQNYFNFGNNSTQGSPTTSTAKQIQQQTVQPRDSITERISPPQLCKNTANSTVLPSHPERAERRQLVMLSSHPSKLFSVK
jgi:hypothetical protein